MTVASVRSQISPQEVHNTLARHMLADGFDLVVDLERSRGSRLYDSREGKTYIDLFGCFATSAVGFNHPKMQDPEFVEELTAAAQFKLSNSDLYTTQMADFVDAFSRTVPEPLRRHMFFIEGGALAVENCLKVAFDWKRRKNMAAGRPEAGSQVVHFRHAFHGRTGYTMSLTNTDPTKTDYYPKFTWPRIHTPALSFPATDQVLARAAEDEAQAVAEIEMAVREHGHDIAALIVEPIQGEGGDNHFRGEFLRELRRLADEHEFLLLFDEVQTGFGTTGAWWCHEHFDVFPDAFAFGKKTQVCGICVSERIDDVDNVFKISSRINSTWGGNIVDMVRCKRFVEIIEEDDLLQNAARVGAQLVEGLQAIARANQDWIGNVRGRGMFVAFDLPDPDARRRVLASMLELGVLGLASGTKAIRFRPALNFPSEDAAEALKRVGQAVASARR